MEDSGNYKDFVAEFGEDNGFDVWPEPVPMVVDENTILYAITKLKSIEVNADIDLKIAVAAARERNISWSQIAQAAGVSKSAAFSRWSEKGREHSRKYQSRIREQSRFATSQAGLLDNGFDI